MNAELKNYSGSSYYRYKWCTSTSSCSATWTRWQETSSSTSTSVAGTIKTPTLSSGTATYYLWIEGDIKDAQGGYMLNSTNINGILPNSSTTRIFKFFIDATLPTVSYKNDKNYTQTSSSTIYSKTGSMTITISDNIGFNYYNVYYYLHIGYHK